MMAREQKAWLAVGFLAACAAASTPLGIVGCGGSEKTSGVGESRLPEGAHSETIDHEACDESGHRVDTLDTNNDGRADIKRVYDNKTGKEVCRITDLDHDGKPDLYEYYDGTGVIRRRESSFDGSGIVDSVEYFEGGKLAKRELDTTGQHRIDTWDYFDPATGKRTRRERDSTNDGRVDQWWTYDGEKVTIAIDRNGDGKPDPSDTVTIGGDQASAPPALPGSDVDAGATASPAASAPPDAGGPPPVTDATALLGDAGATAPKATHDKNEKSDKSEKKKGGKK
ncbi:MAG TPA: hypothetical protein VGI39_19890 [Polyangiaceae bacterium]